MNCIFCQNWHHRKLLGENSTISAKYLAAKVDEKTSCICFFGGDPSTQMPHALTTSKIAFEDSIEKNRILRICWETNGRMLLKYAQEAIQLSMKSGGNMKIDLKTWDENLNNALCGITNQTTLKNFKKLGENFFNQRPELPVLSASTLLIPGYVDCTEVERIASFIADINKLIPYTLLAFHPAFLANDLPATSKKQAQECIEKAKKHLKHVRLGNTHLLS